MTKKPALSVDRIRAIVQAGKPGVWSHGHGLVLAIAKSGSAFWGFRYTFSGQRRLITLDSFDDEAIAEQLRELEGRADSLRKGIKKGIDPAHARNSEGKTNSRVDRDQYREVIEKHTQAIERDAFAIEQENIISARIAEQLFRIATTFEQLQGELRTAMTKLDKVKMSVRHTQYYRENKDQKLAQTRATERKRRFRKQLIEGLEMLRKDTK